MLRRGADVRAVTFKVAMLIALGNVRALDDALCALLHAAVAGDGNLARSAIWSRDKLPACSSAVGAILKRHADSIRLRQRNGKLWNVVISGSGGDSGAGFLNTEFTEDTERAQKR